MRLCCFILFAASLLAGTEQQLALARQAQADFARVEAAAVPQVSETEACLQSEAAWLAVAPLTEAAQAHYQKGYCLLAGAAVSRSEAAFQEAAAEFDRAGVPKLLAALSRAQTSHPDEAALRQAAAQPDSVYPQALWVARDWLGFFELGKGNLIGAAREFSAGSSPAWQKYVAAKQAYDRRQFAEAAADYRASVELWDRQRKAPPSRIFELLEPRPNLETALLGEGGAEILAGDCSAAIGTLDRAIKMDPAAARAYYLRARAEELAGRSEPAMTDYNMASRAAFAAARDLASGEAHLYRGIMLYHRQDFRGAENEFSSALNFDIGPEMHSDAAAWRHLAAVAAGACEASRSALGRELATVSPYFPSDEATRRLNSCPAE